MKKRTDKCIKIVILFSLILSLLTLAGCSSNKDEPALKQGSTGKIKIVTTLFPQYDFARQIAGDQADIALLLPPGVESHSYEPTPSDMIKIKDADLFLYTGENMEIWSQSIIDGLEDSDCKVVNLSKDVELIDDGDPHFWTDPLIAKKMVDQISEALCSIDPGQADYYRGNAEQYKQELDRLDTEFRSVVENGKRNEMIFGSAFALSYFTKEYDLEHEAAFDSCSSETEPSAKVITHLINKIKQEKIPVVYYMEIEEPKVARSISRETGAKMLLFHSCHNLTKEEFDRGETYLSIMEQNVQNLKEGLN